MRSQPLSLLKRSSTALVLFTVVAIVTKNLMLPLRPTTPTQAQIHFVAAAVIMFLSVLLGIIVNVIKNKNDIVGFAATDAPTPIILHSFEFDGVSIINEIAAHLGFVLLMPNGLNPPAMLSTHMGTAGVVNLNATGLAMRAYSPALNI